MNAKFLKTLRGRQVVVNTVDSQSFRGVLSSVHTDVLVLDAPEFLADEVTTLEGRAVVPRANVSWVQVL